MKAIKKNNKLKFKKFERISKQSFKLFCEKFLEQISKKNSLRKTSKEKKLIIARTTKASRIHQLCKFP